jgi:hypothetical protein
MADPGRAFATLFGGADEPERAMSDTTTATITPTARAEINSFARAVRQSLPIS